MQSDRRKRRVSAYYTVCGINRLHAHQFDTSGREGNSKKNLNMQLLAIRMKARTVVGRERSTCHVTPRI